MNKNLRRKKKKFHDENSFNYSTTDKISKGISDYNYLLLLFSDY